jgi:hypothetical protein
LNQRKNSIFSLSLVKNIKKLFTKLEVNSGTLVTETRSVEVIRDLTILGRQRDGEGQNKLLQINGSI